LQGSDQDKEKEGLPKGRGLPDGCIATAYMLVSFCPRDLLRILTIRPRTGSHLHLAMLENWPSQWDHSVFEDMSEAGALGNLCREVRPGCPER